MQYDCSLCMLQYLKVEIFNYCSCLTAISFTVEKLLNLPVNTDYHCCFWRCNYQRQQFAEITFFNLWKLCLRNLVLFTNYWFFDFRDFWPQPRYWLLTLSYTGSGTYIVKQGGANLPRMTFGFENYQNCPQM